MALPDYFFLGPDVPGATRAADGSGVISRQGETDWVTAGVSDSPSQWSLSGAGNVSVTYDISGGAYSDVYINAAMRIISNSGADRGFLQINGPTEPIFRLFSNNSSEDWSAELWNGASWVQVGSTIINDTATAVSRWDIRLNIANSGGRVVVTKDGVNRIDFTGDTLLSTDTTAASIVVQKPGGTTAYITYFQYVMAHNADISNVRLVEDIVTSLGGFNNLQSGIYQSIDNNTGEAGTGSAVTAASDGQGATFNFASLLSQFGISAIESVVISIHNQPSADPALYIKPRARIAAANYDGAGVQNAAGAWYQNTLPFVLDPATGLPWANAAAVDAAELGFVLSAAP